MIKIIILKEHKRKQPLIKKHKIKDEAISLFTITYSNNHILNFLNLAEKKFG